MKTFDIEEIRSWDPCYDPTRYLTDVWTGTVVDILDDDRIPFPDRLWVALRTDLVSEKLIHLFAVWCARHVQHLMTDKRSLDALDIAERFAIDNATEEERDAAGSAAWAAAGSAAFAAAGDAAGAAALIAAWAAVRAAALDASLAAARDAQKTKLREMIIAGVTTGDTK